MVKQDRGVFLIFVFVITAFFVCGLLIEGPKAAVTGFAAVQMGPARLINDFFANGGPGGALVNSAIVGLTGLVLVLALDVRLTGPIFAAILTMMGFGLFGKTPLNIIPVIAGVFISGRIVGKSPREYIIIALFGTALGPLVSSVIYEIGLSGLPAVAAGTAVGIVAGGFLPAVAVSMLHMHQGYNLYNMGLTCGFVSLFASSIIRNSGHSLEPYAQWCVQSPFAAAMIIPVLSAGFIVCGLALGGAWGSFRRIQKESGRLPSDFIDNQSLQGSLLNSGFIGLAASAYVYIVGGSFNGPVIGGIMTIMGFGAFGTHLRNSWPVVLGVVLTVFITGMEPAAPGPLLAAIFCTTLAPIAGQFGIIPGIIAGMIHMTLVAHTGGWQGGINLYNNGFAGGLTATLMVSVGQWYRNSRNGFRKKK